MNKVSRYNALRGVLGICYFYSAICEDLIVSCETALDVTGDWTLVQQPWYLNLAKEESRAREPILKEKVHLEIHKGRRSEPAGLRALGK